MKFKPYEEYRDAEYEWLGAIPRHWRPLPIKSITKIKSIRQKDIDIKFDLLSVYRDFGVIRRSSKDDNHNIIPEDLSNYKIVNKGDLVLNKMKVWQGSLGISEYQGIVSPAYIVCNITCEINKKYLNYLLRNRLYLTIYNQLSYGIRVDQWDIRYNDFKDIKILFPPKEEQDKIVEFLDDKLEKIDRFIELREKQIELFQEEKEVLINNAVTKGIDRSVAYKDNGIDWIGKIPEHWEVIRLKNVVTNIESGVWGEEAKGNEEDLVCIRAADFNMINLKANELHLTIRNIDINKNKHRILKNGDLILEKSGGGDKQPVGRVIYFESEDLSVCSNFLAKFTPNEEILSRYLLYFLHNIQIRREHMSFINQTTGIQNLDMNKYFSNKILHPPIEEQKQIVAHIEKETSKIDKTIDLYKKQIDLIKEYRTSLISQAVTGKIDVRSF